jgi:outer membrane biosynthesis protein TonB
MRSSLTASFGLHILAIIIATFGLPSLWKPPAPIETPPPIDVELVTLASVTNAPTRPRDVAPPRDDPKPEPPKPEPAKPVETPPPSKAEPPPPQPQAVAPPEPKLAPVPEVKPEPKPEPKPQAPAELNNTKPTKKPKAPEDFDSILKNLAKNLPQQKAEPKAEAKKSAPQQSFDDLMKNAIPANRRSPGDPSQQLTMNEQDYINNVFRRAMQRCWNIDPGAKGAKDLVVNIKVTLAQDGSVTSVKLDDSTFGKSDYWKVAAESAVRAVRSCSPYPELAKIPYDKWRDALLVFNPADMF